jgi:hypothetical protein
VIARDVDVTRLLGRRVRDVEGRAVGRIEELVCEVELREQGRDYVVREFHVGAFGLLEALTGSAFARALLRRFGGASRYKRYCVSWEWMDLRDPERPRLTRTREELPEAE